MNDADILLAVVEWAVDSNCKLGLKLPMDRPWHDVTEVLARQPSDRRDSYASNCTCGRAKAVVRSFITANPKLFIYIGQCPACEKIFFGWKG